MSRSFLRANIGFLTEVFDCGLYVSGNADLEHFRSSDVIVRRYFGPSDVDLSGDCDSLHAVLVAVPDRHVSDECRHTGKIVQPSALADRTWLRQLMHQPHHIRADVAPIQSSPPRCKYCRFVSK